MLHLNFDILDWCSKDYVPVLNQSTESLWTSSEPAECFWTCPSTSWRVLVWYLSCWVFSLCLCCRLCGSKPENTVITSRSNVMTIKFHSDSSYVDQGFTAEYETFVPTNRKTWSPFLLVHPTVFVQSFHGALCSVSDCLLPSISVSRTVPVHQQPVHQHDAALWRLERLWRRQRRGQLQWVRTMSCGPNTTTCDGMFCFECGCDSWLLILLMNYFLV